VRVRFGDFTLDSETRQLLRNRQEVPLSPKAFDLLTTLLARRPKVVDKAVLHAEIWPDTFVVDANLTVLIAEIRRALADTPRSSRFIRTAHTAGYAFCGDATDLDRPSVPAPSGAPRFWLAWNDRTLVLAEGDNVIGRDPQCDTWLDAAGVSRRHARIQIDSASRSVVLEDLGSTNGTFRQRVKITGREPVSDGDVIRIGSVELTFRVWFADRPRETERIKRPRR
jgi:DNA-binding winged helix-turn-helix (wHTH) protein